MQRDALRMGGKVLSLLCLFHLCWGKSYPQCRVFFWVLLTTCIKDKHLLPCLAHATRASALASASYNHRCAQNLLQRNATQLWRLIWGRLETKAGQWRGVGRPTEGLPCLGIDGKQWFYIPRAMIFCCFVSFALLLVGRQSHCGVMSQWWAEKISPSAGGHANADENDEELWSHQHHRPLFAAGGSGWRMSGWLRIPYVKDMQWISPALCYCC